MKYDFSDLFTSLVIQAEPDLATRLEYQGGALQETKCTSPLLGRWIDAHDVVYLFSVLALKDKDFAGIFPSMAHVTAREREQLSAVLERHFEDCTHCSLKRGYDLEMDARIEQACRQNSEFLLQELRQDQAGASEEPNCQKTAPERVLKAHQ